MTPTVLIVDADAERSRWVSACLAGSPPLAGAITVARAATLAEAAASIIAAQPVACIVGHGLTGDHTAMPAAVLSALRAAVQAAAPSPGRHGDDGDDGEGGELALPPVIYLSSNRAGAAGPGVMDAMDAMAERPDELIYLLELGETSGLAADSGRTSAAHALVLLVCSVVQGRPVAPPPERATVGSAAEARQLQRILDLAGRLATQTELDHAEALCADAVVSLIDATRAYCLFYDAGSGALWSERLAAETTDDSRAAIAGLAGFAARTGLAICVHRASADPRYAAAMDDPAGTGDERIAVQPVFEHYGDADSAGHIHAVLVAVRVPKQPAFTAEDTALLARFAAQVAPCFSQLALRSEATAMLLEEEEDDAGLFRREAMDAYRLRGRYGDVIRVSPGWVSWAYLSLVLILTAAIVYAAIGTIDQYSAGPAVVRMAGRTEVTSALDATVTELHARPGERVLAGQLLASLHDAAQEAAVARLYQEFATQLRNRMLDPADPSAAQAVRSLQVELANARAALEERRVRAHKAGVVGDIRVRPGQRIAPGQTLLTIADGSSEPYVIALLPGADRPQLTAGMPLRLELAGYRYAYQRLTVTAVAAEVIGPAEAQRILGAQVADAVPLSGPLVMVQAHLPGPTFTADGDVYHYHDGMLATAEVRVRQKTILETLIPALERL